MILCESVCHITLSKFYQSLSFNGFRSRDTSEGLCTLTLGLNFCNEHTFSLLSLSLALVLHRSLLGGDTRTVFTVLVVSAEDAIAPPERGGEVVREGHVVEVMMLSARPEGNNVL